MAAAEAAIARSGGELIVRTPGGRVRKSFVLGRSAMEKLNAVEGITLSARAQQTFAEIRRLWCEGIDSGQATALDVDEIKRRGRERLAALKAGGR